MAVGRHHVETGSGDQMLICPIRKQAVVMPLDGNAQKAIVGRGANGIRPAQVLAVDPDAKRQILPRAERKRRTQIVRDIQGDWKSGGGGKRVSVWVSVGGRRIIK